jgi:cytochrome c553
MVECPALHCRIGQFCSNLTPQTMKLLAPLMLAAALAAPALAAAQDAKAPAKPDLAKGEAKYTAVCAACHGADGNSGIPANPKLAGQHPTYLVKQLQEFKEGKRNSAVMKGFAAVLSDDDMKNIAAWLAAQKPKTGFAKDKDLVALGERIYRGGIPDRQIAACAGCHSPNGAGIPAQYPRMSGQHADYTEAQLTAFRVGARSNSVQMNQVAAKMNDREIKAVSDYIAGLR